MLILIMSQPLIVAFWFKILHLNKILTKSKRNSKFASINFGICEIFAILNYPNLVTCIDNVTAIDWDNVSDIYVNILVYNFTLKSKYRQNQREIPSLLTIKF